MKTATLTIALALVAGSLTACSESQTEDTQTNATGANTTSAEWLLASAPANATPVAQAKTSAEEGETVTVTGIIGGAMDAINEKSPVFRIVDASVHNACTSDDDHCSTPWDYCCAPRAEITRNSATVQVVDASGAPITESLIAAGLKPLDMVTVTGTVAARPSEDVLTIKATGVHRTTPAE